MLELTTPARVLRWSHSQLWLATSAAAWPEPLRRAGPGELPRPSQALTANATGRSCAIAGKLACFTASGGSYFAQGGCVLTPRASGELLVSALVTSAASEDEPRLVELLAQGAAAAELRPAGDAVFCYLATHPVDGKAWAWRALAAMLVRLAVAGTERASDLELVELAQDCRRRATMCR